VLGRARRGRRTVQPGEMGQIRRARRAVSAYFLIMGLTTGVWMARIPAVKAQGHLSDGTLGVALFAVPVGLVLGAAAAERLVDRVGSAGLARVCGVASCLLLMTPGLARDLPELMAALLAVGVAGGTLDVAQNAQGVRVEAAYGRPVMTSMHACYSLGAISGSLAGGGFAWAGVAPLPSFAAAGLAGGIVDGWAGRWLLARKHGPGPEGQAAAAPPPVPGAPVSEVPVPGAAAVSEVPLPGAQDARRLRRLIIALGVLGVCGLAGEGAAGDWSAVYLRDNLGAPAAFAALGFAAFSVTMTGGRLAGDRLISRFGTVRLVRWCGLVAAAGLAGGLLTISPYAAVAGFAVFGAGLSVVVPQVFAAGGRADPARPGSGLAKVVGFGYAGMTAGPAVIGAAASRVGLHAALIIPVLLALWIAIAAPALAARAPVLAAPAPAIAAPAPAAAPAAPAPAAAGPAGRNGAEGAEHSRVRHNSRPLAGPGRAPAYGRHMDDKEILGRISELIETEHELRSQLAAGQLSSEQERERLRSAEEALDQCWDLLRQRRARREFGENPDGAEVRPAAEVEGYQQ
jgi:fucose permease